MADVNILLIGNDNWKEKYNIPKHIKLEFCDGEVQIRKGLVDVVILDRDINVKEKQVLLSITRSYCLFVTENATINTPTRELLRCKMGKRLYTGDAEKFFEQDAEFFFPNPYGEKFSNNYLQVNQLFTGDIKYQGKYNLELTGFFGEEFTQVAYWKNNVPIFAGQTLDLYFEHLKSDGVEIKLRVMMFPFGSVDRIDKLWEFDNEQLEDVVRINAIDKNEMIFVSVMAKGEGTINIFSLHDRYSRRDFGFFMPGGERFVTSSGEEIFSYFEPGDFKPPLCFYFSGHKTMEGFEGYHMMRKMGCPFVLIAEARLEGGAFYLGDEEYERKMKAIIRGYMKKMKMGREDVVFSGASMGTFASLYYGCDILPGTLILAKPLANLGNIAKNETLVRVGTFSPSLEVLLKNYGDLSEESMQALNSRLWDKFDKADWSHSKFVIAYQYEDDYDRTAYSDLLSHLSSDGVQVYGKGVHGRHVDNSATIFEWFKKHYAKILTEDFKR